MQECMPCNCQVHWRASTTVTASAVFAVLSAMLLFVGAARLAKPLERLRQKHAAFNQRMVRLFGAALVQHNHTLHA
jgi:hypothetical protein